MMADDGRLRHTLEGSGLLCGGMYTTYTSCVQWSSVNGTWEEYLTLDAERYYHVSWTPDPSIGTYLMGGVNKEAMNPGVNIMNSTTLIKPDGSQEPGFSLKYKTT